MIIRNTNKRQFTKIDTAFARSAILRPDELGLYTVMLAHTDDWDFSPNALRREIAANPEEIRDILRRLEEKGFAVQRRNRYGTVWDLIEDPSAKRTAADAGCASQNSKETPDPEPSPAAAEPQKTNEQMAQDFYALAEKLKKDAAKRKLRS